MFFFGHILPSNIAYRWSLKIKILNGYMLLIHIQEFI